eukprot:2757350-Pleurochrysis_carterae.AAC.1
MRGLKPILLSLSLFVSRAVPTVVSTLLNVIGAPGQAGKRYIAEYPSPACSGAIMQTSSDNPPSGSLAGLTAIYADVGICGTSPATRSDASDRQQCFTWCLVVPVATNVKTILIWASRHIRL